MDDNVIPLRVPAHEAFGPVRAYPPEMSLTDVLRARVQILVGYLDRTDPAWREKIEEAIDV